MQVFIFKKYDFSFTSFQVAFLSVLEQGHTIAWKKKKKTEPNYTKTAFYRWITTLFFLVDETRLISLSFWRLAKLVGKSSFHY